MKPSTIFSRILALILAPVFFALITGNTAIAALGSGHNDTSGAIEGVTLSEFISTALSDNLSIRAKRAAWESKAQRSFSAGALDDPMLTYTQPIEEVETKLGPNKRSLSLSQKFPYPGKLRLKGEIAKKEAELAAVDLESAARELVVDIKRRYFELYYLDMATRLARERIKVLEHFTKAQMNDYSVGEAGLSDVISAETRYADAEYDLLLFEELRRAEASMLNALLNRAPDEPVALVPGLQVELFDGDRELSELYILAKNAEAIKSAELKIDRGQLAEELSSFSSRPNFTVGVKYSEIGEPENPAITDGGKDAYAVTLGMTLPIWTGKTKAKKEEARLARIESEYAKAALSNSIEASIKKSYVNMRSNYKLLKLYSDSLLPKAEKLRDTASIMYKNGKGSIADIFEVRSMVIDFTLAYHRAASNYMKDRAELERLTAGFDLQGVRND